MKRLGINAEARMLQWLVAGLRCPDGRDGGPVHKQTSLRLQLIPFHAMSCNLPMQGYPFLLARFDLKNQFTHWSGSVFFFGQWWSLAIPNLVRSVIVEVTIM